MDVDVMMNLSTTKRILLFYSTKKNKKNNDRTNSKGVYRVHTNPEQVRLRRNLNFPTTLEIQNSHKTIEQKKFFSQIPVKNKKYIYNIMFEARLVRIPIFFSLLNFCVVDCV